MYVMNLRFVVKNQTDGRTNGDIEALADARRALENSLFAALLPKKELERVLLLMKSG
jgi:hypothetical protein